MTSDLDFRQLRLRDARRQVRDLRLDINFAEERIAELPNERMLVHHTIELDNLDKDVVREIDQIFDERETRLRQRLALLLNQLEAAERRLNGLSVVKPRLKQQVVTGKMKPRLAKEIAQ